MTFLAKQFSKRWYRFLLVLLTVGLLTIGLAQPVHAAEFRDGTAVTIGADELIDDDLFITGQTVTVDGIVTGNLFAFGSDITVNGTIEGSLVMAGQVLTANGTVEGSVFASGYSLSVGSEAETHGNLFFSGFNLATASGSQIDHSLYGSGYQMILDGRVADNVNVGAGALEVTGTVGGDIMGSVNSGDEQASEFWMPTFGTSVSVVPPGLRVSDDAQVAGDVSVEIIQPEETEAAAAPFYSLANERTRWIVGELIALLLVGFLFLWLRPKWLHRTSAVAQERWLPSLGTGVLAILGAIILLPVAIGILILLAMVADWISLGQLTAPVLGLGITGLALVTAVFFFLVGMVSKIIVADWGGRLLSRRSEGLDSTVMNFVGLAAGLIIYMLLRALPYGIGFVIGLIITLLGVGAFFLSISRIRWPQLVTTKAPKPVQEQPRESIA